MTLSYRKAIRDLARDLRTTCPDGVVIETPWPAEFPYFSLPAQLAHAQEHRDAVRERLALLESLRRAA